MGGLAQECFVDTGATVSLVSREFVRGPLRQCHLKARGISSDELQVLGEVDLNIQLGDQTFIHSFVVVGIGNTCILGADFLKAGKMLVDVGREMLGSLRM